MKPNKALLIGRLGKDPELHTFDSGNSKASFSLATSEKYRNKDGELVEDTQWHNIVLWGKQAETITEYAKKGSMIAIEGKIVNRSYDSDGVTKYITEIVANSFMFLDKKEDSNSSDIEEPPF